MLRFPEDPTPIDGLRPVNVGRQTCLLIIGDGFVTTFPLPESGDLIIGRSMDADLSIDVTSISRRHALLHIGATIQIEDLGSANGTFVNEQRLARGSAATLVPGTMFELGSIMCILQDSYSAARPRRIWTHGYFEARLEEECARAERCNDTFSVLRIQAEDKQAKGEAMAELLLAVLRPSDILATYGPNDYEVLVVGATVKESSDILERVQERLRAKGANARTGIASYPRDGRVPEALMAKACARVTATDRTTQESARIVVEADVMKSLHKLVSRVAASNINVLILGETGVGKEIFAERIHTLSPRVESPLLRLNCAALSTTMLESELFGHERGAFTGAVAAKPGLLETASGGTVFLDEIGDMPLDLQAKLLRVLETRCVRRVGGLKSRNIDIRIVAATHRDLEGAVRSGAFRQDLFFRLNGISIVVPPLRDRTEEIAALAKSFVAIACHRQGRAPMDIEPQAARALLRYEWPGNIRELRNIMERAVLLSNGDKIALEHFPEDKLASTFKMSKVTVAPVAPPLEPSAPAPRPTTSVWSNPGRSRKRASTEVQAIDLKGGVDEREREIIKDALARSRGNQTQAAKLLGISRRTLISRIEKYGLPRPRKHKQR